MGTTISKVAIAPRNASDDLATKFFRAAKTGYVKLLHWCLEQKININTIDDLRYTAVVWANKNKHPAIIEALMAAGASLETLILGNTVLMYAIMNNDHTTVASLLAAGAKPGTRNYRGSTALILAAAKGNTSIVQMLIAAGSNVDAQNYGGDVPLGHEVPISSKIRQQKCCGSTALIYAAASGHLETVQALITAGAKVNLRNDEDETALMWASHYGHLSVVLYLMARGAEINVVSGSGYTALFAAAYEFHFSIIQALLSNDSRLINIDEKDLSEKTLFWILMHRRNALRTRKEKVLFNLIIERLLWMGTDPYLCDGKHKLLSSSSDVLLSNMIIRNHAWVKRRHIVLFYHVAQAEPKMIVSTAAAELGLNVAAAETGTTTSSSLFTALASR